MLDSKLGRHQIAILTLHESPESQKMSLVRALMSGAIALLGLVLLTLSFAIDVVYLARATGDLVGQSPS